MKKFIFCITMLILFMGVSFNNVDFYNEVINKTYYSGGSVVDFVAGTYLSNDNHKVVINADNTVLFDDTYSLKINSKANGNTITGKIGTNNKAVTFYQVNSTKFINMTVVSYQDSGVTKNLYDYTVFSLDGDLPVEDVSGGFEVWRSNTKIATYSDLQSAVDVSQNGDTIKLNKDLDIVSGAYISGKNIIIDGNNHKINAASWYNSIIIVEKDATLEIKNLTIDGGATGFEVDKSGINIQKDTSTKIPIKSKSDINDPKRNISSIISMGKLNIDNVTISNYYINGDGPALNVGAGEVFINSSKFFHNRSENKGGAISIGRSIRDDELVLSVKDVLIKDSVIEENYSKNGGGVYIANFTDANILNTKLLNNTVTGGKGGAILINNLSSGGFYSTAEKLKIAFPKLNIDNTLFEGNWVGNDGSAIENHDAVLNITNTTFRKNVGIHSSSSCGTLSFAATEIKDEMIIKDCLFEENMGSASTLADHASLLNIKVTGTTFKRNKAVYNSVLIYSSDVLFDNCVFEEEIADWCVVDVRSFGTLEEGYKNNTITFNNTKFINTNKGITDILVRKNSADLSKVETTVVIKGDAKAKIDLWHNNKVSIIDNLEGKINVGLQTPDENVIINENAKLSEEVGYNTEKFLIQLRLYDLEKKEGYNWISRRYIYSDEHQFTREEFYMTHFLSEEGYELKYYIDSDYTTPWDYKVDNNLVIYGRWEEHEHKFEDKYVLYKNKIYNQCECGYLGKSIGLNSPKENEYTGNKIEVMINNELEIKENEYIIEYFVEKDGKWEKVLNPINVGKYKAVLTYKELSIEEYYEIVEKTIVEEENKVIESPPTVDGILICFVLCFVSLLYLLFVRYSKKI